MSCLGQYPPWGTAGDGGGGGSGGGGGDRARRPSKDGGAGDRSEVRCGGRARTTAPATECGRGKEREDGWGEKKKGNVR